MAARVERKFSGSIDASDGWRCCLVIEGIQFDDHHFNECGYIALKQKHFGILYVTVAESLWLLRTRELV